MTSPILPSDRVVVRCGYARGTSGIVRDVYQFNGQTFFSVDFDDFVHFNSNVYSGGDFTEDALDHADGAARGD